MVADLSDTIFVLKLGKVLAEGPYSEMSQNPEAIEAYMGHGVGSHALRQWCFAEGDRTVSLGWGIPHTARYEV
uniref:Branched-chain amino acid ATP-binding cassette transporter C-terminal domain-containing protein n=1 Tax=Magnetospirillum gryphiswaldense TaxID=55518 RepID=A4U213_9PROT|nr:hypothetical protein MGR_2752 [Magnetospirillum gryphiswaldense MSR-1]